MLALVAAAFLRYVWPTPYTYEHMDGLLIRVHRTNDRVDVLGGPGWIPLTRANPFADLAAEYRRLKDAH